MIIETKSRLWLRWVGANALAEMLGLGATFALDILILARVAAASSALASLTGIAPLVCHARGYHIDALRNTKRIAMSTTLTSKGQVTIPKQIRDARKLEPGCAVDFAVNREGELVIQKVERRAGQQSDRFEAARDKADVKWRTDDLMALLRGEG